MTLTSDEIRKLNLIEVLTEEAEASGRPVPELPDDAPTTWTEEQIRWRFASTQPAGSSSTTSSITSRDVHPESAPAAGLPRSFPAPSQEHFSKWFPGLKLSGTAGCSGPRLRVLCFPSAGNAQDMYTSEGTGSRRAPSPLLEWCRAHQAEMLAVEPPGRAARSKEQQYSSLQQLAAALLPVVASRLADGTPYVVVAHSLGTWMAFELLQLEECRGWDINDVVFSTGLWPLYQPLLRADFRLFDEYQLRWPVAPLLLCPVTTFYGSRDRRVKEHMVQAWSRFSSGPFRCQQVEGHHLWPLDKDSKSAWLGHIARELQSLVAAAGTGV